MENKRCPRCNGEPYLCNTGAKYRCRECSYQYTDKVGTAFAKSKLPIEKLLMIQEMFESGQNALEISKAVQIQYKSAWRLCNAIKEHLSMVNQTPKEMVDKIIEMAKSGYSTRAIEFHTGVSKGTVAKYALAVPGHDVHSNGAEHKCKLKKKKFLFCGYCGKCFLDANGEKTSDIKCGRIKRAFCTHRCAMNYRSRERHSDKCKRCNKTRKELSTLLQPDSVYQATGVCFIKDYCPKCYGVLQQFHFDEELASAYELTQTLKQEMRNDRN